jgi:hypothetical protein
MNSNLSNHLKAELTDYTNVLIGLLSTKVAAVLHSIGKTPDDFDAGAVFDTVLWPELKKSIPDFFARSVGTKPQSPERAALVSEIDAKLERLAAESIYTVFDKEIVRH